ncbi:MAG: translation initiation factor [Flavitalea sp.]
MAKKSKPGSGIVYSTDPNFKLESDIYASESLETSAQPLRIWLETKHRGGKAATIIKGYVGTEEDIEKLGKQLKNFCGTGGSAKDGEIIIQGDQRDKVLGWLQKNGYNKSKKAGG